MGQWKAIAGGLMLALAAAAPAAAREPIPIETLAELPFIADPVISPDGKRLAARLNVAGDQRLVLYDLEAPRDQPPKIVPVDGTIRWYGWAGNGRLLVGQTYFTLTLGFLPLSASRLSRYDLATGQMMAVGNPKGLLGDHVIYTDPDGRFVLLSAQETIDQSPSVERIDLATGESVEVQKKRRDIWEWIADGSGTIRAGISYASGDRWTLYTRDPATGEIDRLAKGKTPEPDSAVDAIYILAGGETGIIVTNAPTGRFGAYEYHLPSATIGAPVFEHDKADLTDVLLSADRSRVEGVLFEDDLPGIRWLDPDLQEIQRLADKTFPGKINRIVSRNRDNGIVLIWSGSAHDPGLFYVFDRKARRMDAFAAPYDQLFERPMSEVKPIRYTARDGLSIPGYLTLPRGREATNLPLIVLPHGGPFARTSFTFDPWVQLLADRGYAVLQPNFRGSTGFGRDLVERGYGQMGLAMQDDLDDGVDWLAGQGIVDPKRVCLVGASYGGYAAMWGAIRNPERYRCAVSFAGVSDIRAQLKHDKSMFFARRYSKIHRKKIEGEEKRDLAAVSPLQQAARLKVPLLLAHGERDSTVPADQSRKMLKALREAGIPVQGAFFAASGHDLENSADSADFLRRLEAFLEVHNPAGPAPAGARPAQAVSAAIERSEIDARALKKAKAGAATLRYRVTPDGRVEGCSVSASSGGKDVDKQLCRIAEERFQYRPALDESGSRIASEASLTVSLEEKKQEGKEAKGEKPAAG